MPCVFWDACTFAVGRDSPESRGSRNSLLAFGLAPAIFSDPRLAMTKCGRDGPDARFCGAKVIFVADVPPVSRYRGYQ